jgi:uncharacterized protein
VATTSASARALDRPRVARVRALADWALPVYFAVFALAETMVAVDQATAGAVIDGVLLLALVNHYALTAPAQRVRRRGTVSDALPVLTLLPLMRILSLALPLGSLPVISRYVTIGGSVLVSAAMTGRLIGLHANELGLRVDSWRRQLKIAVAGLPLGFLGYVIAKPAPLTDHASVAVLIGQILVLAVFVAFAEELLFRGMLQATLHRVAGLSGVAWSTMLFTAAYLGTRDLAFIPFVALIGLLFGACARRTGSIAGTTIAHALLLAGLLVVWPHVLGTQASARHHHLRPSAFSAVGAPGSVRDVHGPLATPAKPEKAATTHRRRAKRHKQAHRAPAVTRTAAPPTAVTPAPTQTVTPQVRPTVPTQTQTPRVTTPQRTTTPKTTTPKSAPRKNPPSSGSGGTFDDSG